MPFYIPIKTYTWHYFSILWIGQINMLCSKYNITYNLHLWNTFPLFSSQDNTYKVFPPTHSCILRYRVLFAERSPSVIDIRIWLSFCLAVTSNIVKFIKVEYWMYSQALYLTLLNFRINLMQRKITSLTAIEVIWDGVTSCPSSSTNGLSSVSCTVTLAPP